jgi:eukaryotic-like serine/threonine-protein kinase
VENAVLRRLIVEIHRRSLWQVVAIFCATGWAVLQVIDVLIDNGILPDWVFRGGLALLLIGLPIVLATAFVQEGTATSGAADSDTDAPTGTPHGDTATSAAERGAAQGRARAVVGGGHPASGAVPRHARLLTWRNAIAGGVLAFALLGFASAGYMGMRTFGIGAPGTLLAQGVLERGAAVVIADFESTADGELGDVVTRALVIDLLQSPTIRVLDRAQLREPLTRMQAADDARMTSAVAIQLAEREGHAAVITGDVAPLGTGYVLTASILGGDGFARLAGFRETARSEAELVDAVERLSRSIRDKAGESLRSVRSGRSLAQVTTASLPALRAYTRGMTADAAGDMRTALSEYERAIELDSTFAMAHRKVSAMLNNLGIRPADRRRAVRRAWELSERLPELERHLATGYYHDHVSGDVDAAIRAYEAAMHIDSTDVAVRNSLSNAYRRVGRVPEAIALLAGTLRDQPIAAIWLNLAFARFQAGDIAAAEATLDSASVSLPEWSRIDHMRSQMAAAYGDYDAADARLAEFRARARTPFERMLERRSRIQYAAVRGRVLEAERILDEPGAELFLADPVLVGMLRAELMLARGDTAAATRIAQELLTAHDGTDADLSPMLWIASEARDLALTSRLIAWWNSAVPPGERGVVGRTDTEFYAARAARLSGDHARAVATLQSLLDWCRMCGWYAHEEIGLTLAEMGRIDEAIHALETGLAVHEASRSADILTRPLVYRRLAELHDAAGNRQQAVEHYARFVQLWQHADPELQPQVRAAQQRIASLMPDR